MDAQAQLWLRLLASASPHLGDSPVPRRWPCLCHCPCCCQWDGAHSYPTTGSGAWVCLLTGGMSESTAGCTSRGHHYGHHQEQQLSLVPLVASGPESGAAPHCSPVRGRQHPQHMSSYSSPRCQYQQRNRSQETIALLFPSGMTDPYLHTHVLTASLSMLHKAYSMLSSSSPFLGAQDMSHAVLSTSTTPAASG